MPSNFTLGVDIPYWESAFVPLITAGHGTTFAYDMRGTDRYIYFMYGTGGTYRLDTWTDGYIQVAYVGAYTSDRGSSCFDPTYGVAGGIWFMACVNTPTAQFPYFGVYDIAQNSWTSKSVTNLPNPWNGLALLCHTCSSYNAAGNDDYVYLAGGNSTFFARYSISGNSWTIGPTMTQTPKANSYSGVLIWQPGYDPDKLFFTAGTDTSFYLYSILNNTWTPFTYGPPITVISRSGGIPYGVTSSKILFNIRRGTNIGDEYPVYQLDLSTGELTSFLPPITCATATNGGFGTRMAYVKNTEFGVEWLYSGQDIVGTPSRVMIPNV